jgi:hypothetical protein
MTLRIMLLGLVASMGFELPSGADLKRWAENGQGWVTATMADRSGHCVEAVPADVVLTDCRQAAESCHAPIVVEQPNASEDKAFEAASTAMVADFAADLVAKAPETLPSVLEPVIEVVEAPEVGLPAGEEIATQVIVETKVDIVDVAEVTEKPATTTELTEVMHERLDRISHAVRLTRDAVQAWADVVQDPIDEISPAY